MDKRSYFSLVEPLVEFEVVLISMFFDDFSIEILNGLLVLWSHTLELYFSFYLFYKI